MSEFQIRVSKFWEVQKLNLVCLHFTFINASPQHPRICRYLRLLRNISLLTDIVHCATKPRCLSANDAQLIRSFIPLNRKKELNVFCVVRNLNIGAALVPRTDSIDGKMKWIHFHFWYIWLLLFKHKLVSCFEQWL